MTPGPRQPRRAAARSSRLLALDRRRRGRRPRRPHPARRLLLRPRARLPLRAQHPRHPPRRLLRRHHRHRPDDAAHRRRVRPLGRLGRRPLRRGRRQADDRRRPACPDRAPRRPRRPARSSASSTASSSSRLRIPAFIQTLGMLFIGQGLIQLVTNGDPVYPLPPSVGAFGMADVDLRPRLELRLLRRRRGRRRLRPPPDRARPQHVRHRRQRRGRAPRRHRHRPLQDRRLRPRRRRSPPSPACSSWPTSPAAPPRSARGWELSVIAGVVVGGVSLFGGAGTLAGGIVGVLLLQVVHERPRRHRRQLQLAADRRRRDHGARRRPRHRPPPLSSSPAPAGAAWRKPQ